MGYRAMEAMVVKVPDMSNCRNLNYAQEALRFIREDCEDLKFDAEKDAYEKAEGVFLGKSKKNAKIPYNMERDLDRLCFENAIARFVETGSRNDAFDVYYCYCEIFKPFGEGSGAARALLDLLSDHEANASSLLAKHRDHYSHSVYVFITGLSLFKRKSCLQNAYNETYKDRLADAQTLNHHFLEHWGFTALFHDIGYPFEIAHQQIKNYLLTVMNHISKPSDSEVADEKEGRLPQNYPFVSYQNLDAFMARDSDSYDKHFTDWVKEHLESGYISDLDKNNSQWKELLVNGILKYHIEYDELLNLGALNYMDHAYFSALMLAKAYKKSHESVQIQDFPQELKDCLCAIILHNSLFSRKIRDFFKTKNAISLHDNVPLTYLLILCDEMQCSDRSSYGQDTRKEHYPICFDFKINEDHKIRGAEYTYDRNYEAISSEISSFNNMQYRGKDNDGTTVRRCEFVDKIHRLVNMGDLFPNYISDTSINDDSQFLSTKFEAKRTDGVIHFSTSSYIKLYNLAVYLHSGYNEVSGDKALTAAEQAPVTGDSLEKIREKKKETKQDLYNTCCKTFEEELSLEYKLSNIGQAKGFADCLHNIGCFYTDRMMDLEVVSHFTKNELRKLAEQDHERWCREKIAMGWLPYYGTAKLDSAQRELVRQQPALTHYSLLSAQHQEYTTNAMTTMLKLLKEEEGLQVYRF